MLAPLLLSFAVIFVAGWSQNYVKPDKHLQEYQEDVDVLHRLLGVLRRRFPTSSRTDFSVLVLPCLNGRAESAAPQ